MADRFAERIRAAAALDCDEDEPSSATPLQQLRQLAAHAESESVRVQAVKVLLERDDAERERREREREAAAAIDCYSRALQAMSDEELDAELDSLQAATIGLLLDGHVDAARYPQTTALIEREVERRVERRLRQRREQTAQEGEPLALSLAGPRYVTDSGQNGGAQVELAPRRGAFRRPEGREPYHGWPSGAEPERSADDES